ncbi:hypothetical protein GCM10010472_01540 [Pseudonocardia halophobica]|uniref:Uncharacterized protein n=1 Tax=Pseudonocardia halophobica TaxID=29401 RepID=A0A9W6L3P1_9PSEU|nr:hypothetical protein [Pseudonocardia halophobica]GLL10494.1 hypothetical protein GCM10017577_16340 [Pseudonocardia halophobica]
MTHGTNEAPHRLAQVGIRRTQGRLKRCKRVGGGEQGWDERQNDRCGCALQDPYTGGDRPIGSRAVECVHRDRVQAPSENANRATSADERVRRRPADKDIGGTPDEYARVDSGETERDSGGADTTGDSSDKNWWAKGT